MRYTLEIQKLLLQTQNKNLHPREKANLLKEAIRIADENEDVEWATEMRLDLIYELNLLSADAEEITVFSKILDDYENHKYNRQIKKFPTEKQNVSLKHILTQNKM